MYVIAGIEWVENYLYKKSPTQLSAVRVNSSFYDWNHVAWI
jgi:hypothetical protein